MTKRFDRVVVIAPTRSTCLNISIALSNGVIPLTLLMQEKGKEIFEAVDMLPDLGGFGVVAGTGTGKTVAIRDIAQRVLGESLRVDEEEQISRENPDTFELLGKQYPVTYRQGYAPSIDFGDVDADENWKYLPETGIKLPSGREVVVVLKLGYASIFGSDIPELWGRVRQYSNQKQWQVFEKAEIQLPTDEIVPEVVVAEYGRDALTGETLVKYGATTLNTSSYRSQDFEGKWYDTRQEAEAARAKVQAKLGATKAERQERVEYVAVLEKAEPIRARIRELYDKQYYNSDLDQDLCRRIREWYVLSLPLTSTDLKQWIFETEAFITEVEKAVAETMKKKAGEQQKLRDAEGHKRKALEEKMAKRERLTQAARTGDFQEETPGFNSLAAALVSAKRKQKR